MIDAAVKLCERVSYLTAQQANEARKNAESHFGTSLRSIRCDKCEAWHLSFAYKLSAREMGILRDLAFGFRASEICESMGMSHDVFYKAIFRLINRVGALSRNHLTAVAISIGVVNIFEKEPEHAHQRDRTNSHRPSTSRASQSSRHARN